MCGSNATRELDDAEKTKYILGRWPTRSTSPEHNPEHMIWRASVR